MEEIVLGVKVGVGDGKRSIADLRNEMNQLKGAIENAEPGTKDMDKAIALLGERKGDLKELKETLVALDPGDKAKAFIGLGQTIVAGFTAAQGAAALFGAENEDIQKGILKIQSAIGILHGIQAAADAKDQVNRLRIIALRQLEILETKNQIVATEGATVAQRLLNLAMALNPATLILTAIIALTAALVAYSATTKDNTKEVTANTKALEKQREAYAGLKDDIEGLQQELLKEKGIISEATKSRLDLIREEKNEKIRLAKEYAEEAAKQENKNNATQATLRSEYELNLLSIKQKYKLKRDILDEKARNEEKDAEKKHQEDLLKIKEEAHKKELDEFVARKFAELDKRIELHNAERSLVENQTLIASTFDEEAYRASLEKQKYYNDLKIEEARREQEARFQIAQDVVSGLSSLADILIQDGERSKKAKRNIALAEIAIDTAKAIAGLTAASETNPANGITFGAAGIAQFSAGIIRILANIAKAKQLLSGGGSPGASAPSAGGGISQTPRIQTPQVEVPTTKLNKEQSSASSPMEIRVSVLESDITSTQQRVKVIQDRATF